MSYNGNSGQDWDQVVLRKSRPKAANAKQAVNQARLHGEAVETHKKFNAGGNQQRSGANASKLEAAADDEEEGFDRQTVSRSVAQVIQQQRQLKEMSQKDLGTAINEKPQVIGDFESGRAAPNQQVLGKLERVLGVKLRGRDIGQPLPARGKGRGKK